jgi:hypothetical protein
MGHDGSGTVFGEKASIHGHNVAENHFSQIPFKVSGKSNNQITPAKAEDSGNNSNDADKECQVK